MCVYILYILSLHVENMVDIQFVLKIHHGGVLVRGAITKYVGGTTTFTHIDLDRCGILDVQEEAESIGYKSLEYNM